MKIELYLNGKPEPFKTITPPEEISFDTTSLMDGEHVLTVVSRDDNGKLLSKKQVPFKVQNGPTIDIHGLNQDETIHGERKLIINAYGSQVGDEFEIDRIETPAPTPTWAWVLTLVVFTICAGFLTTSYYNRDAYSLTAVAANASASTTGNSNAASSNNSDATGGYDQKLGQTVYNNNCGSCHQANGNGLPGVFPPLVGNSVVLDDDPTEHILAILDGVSGKVIDGVNYASPMPGFKNLLTDEQVAAVVNHERKSWGNDAKITTAEFIAGIRK